MVNNLREEDRPEPWKKRKPPVPTSDRETRTSSRANAKTDKVQEPKASNLPTGSSRGRRNSKGKGVQNAKGMKKTKPMPAATVDVLVGRRDNPIRSVEEQIKKNEEDARACGRIPRTILNPANRKSCPTTASLSWDGEQTGRNSAAAALQVPCSSPNTLPVEVLSGRTVNY